MYNVKCYDGVNEADNHISTHFKVKEFACSDGSRPVFVSDDLVNMLENIRQHFGKPITITSGFRTASYNKKVSGSSSNSMHTYGIAADIKVENVSPESVYQYASEALGAHGGVILYDTFVHIDMRSNKYRGDSRTKKG